MDKMSIATPVAGMTKLRKTIANKMNEHQDDQADEQREFGHQHVGEVHENGGIAANQNLDS